MTVTDPAVLSARDAAEALGLSESAVYEAVRRGDIPNAGVGRTVRIPRSFIDRQIGTPTPASDGDTIVLELPADDAPSLERLVRVARIAAELSGLDTDRTVAARLELAVASATSSEGT